MSTVRGVRGPRLAECPRWRPRADSIRRKRRKSVCGSKRVSAFTTQFRKSARPVADRGRVARIRLTALT